MVTTYLEGKEQDVVFHAPWGKVRPREVLQNDVGARVFYCFTAFGFYKHEQKVKKTQKRTQTKFFKSMNSCVLPVLFFGSSLLVFGKTDSSGERDSLKILSYNIKHGGEWTAGWI